jgi:hypothetical protein
MQHKSDRAQQNASRIENSLDDLELLLNNLTGPHWGKFWGEVKQVNELFRTTKPIDPEARERLWQRLGSICEEAKGRQSGEQNRLERLSAMKRDLIEGRLRSIEAEIGAIRTMDQYRSCKQRLAKIPQLMKTGWVEFSITMDVFKGFAGDEGRLTNEDREALWNRYVELRSALKYRLGDVQKANYEHMKSVAYGAKSQAEHGDPYEAINTIKTLQLEVKNYPMNNDQYQTVKGILEQTWRAASSRIEERKRQGERSRKEWQERMNEKIDRLSGLIDKNEAVIDRLQSQISDLESQIASAWTDDFADRAQGWIEEKYDKIRDIESTNRDLHAKIRDIEEKLRS